MRKLTLIAISNLLRGAQYIPLLPHQSVQIPLSSLIRNCLDLKLSQQPDQEQAMSTATFDEEFLALLETISLKIAQIPSCIHFFIDEKDGSVTFPIFDCLILHVQHHDTRGERSRQAIERLLDVASKGKRVTRYILSTDFTMRVVRATIDSYLNICEAYSSHAEITGRQLDCLVFCSQVVSVSAPVGHPN